MLTPRFYGGSPTAFGAPFAAKSSDLSAYDVAFLGIPWQSPAAPGRETSIVYAGTMMAPLRFRYNSIKYGGYLPELDIHVFERLRFCDYGNADIVFDLQVSMDNVTRKVGEIIDAGCIPLTLGGNGPGAANPVLRAIAERAGGPVAIVNFDAHHDNMVLTPEEMADPRSAPWGEGWANMIFDIPNVAPELFQHVGLRGPRNDRDAIKRFLDRGARRENIYTYREYAAARNTGIEHWAQMIADRTSGAAKIWIAIDPDVLDMDVAPHGEPLGLHVAEVVQIMRQVGKAAGRSRIGGMSFMAMPPDAIPIHWICVYMMLYAFAGMLEGEQ
jgi:arginase family enzyme